MKNLIVYDSTGNAFFVQEGTFYEPQGEIKVLQADIPINKALKGVDVKTGQPILEDIPKSEIELLKEKVASLTEANAELTSIVANMETKNV
ncbi:hypothetical protein NE172_10925 [Clostridium botulinum]|uniref:Uncharacterized protein n=1 Tax=Clostridium botulinum TaxID=1491 RepID=A0A6B4JNZ6_CLOBO|nr:hypothetical protein [Clostridium botulinum]EES49245.1 conserved hypothetical protein [Clostridium botulinum E1 str. 'BoNT E Beluga']MBY6761851.1 hypothetical protein [Clostridium botulinum]MBY6920777.1 hypothetical protein [Clostridium botulinum]MCR1131475.1 hypothetical protein [Clostridium botulinum]NFJ58620.1 hypothetical protein [Clostridium botulinum]